MARKRIRDIQAALEERSFPTVTVWNRIEGRPRTAEFGRALAAEVRDPLWMLTRQWQFGEFAGEDAGTPVTAKYHLRTTRAERYRAKEGPAGALPTGVPLEAVVEARPVPFAIGDDPVALDLRLAIGRRWLRLIPAALRAAYVTRWPIALPDPSAEADTTRVAHPEVWSTLQAVSGRAMDGYAFYRHLTGGGTAFDGIPGLTQQQRDQVTALAPRLVSWFDQLIMRPTAGAAYDATRLEHRFDLAAPEAAGETVLAAEEYPGGHLDWYAFSYDRSGTSLGSTGKPSAVTRTVVPGEVRFSGMPHPRWWAMEDGRTDFGAVTPDTTDLIRLLFLEFALVFSNDWFVLPCDLPEGTLARIDGLAVTDVFGERFWIEPAGAGSDEDWQRWSLFTLDVQGSDDVAADLGLFIPPSVPHTADGAPLEDVMMIRDELANMVWGVERTVLLASGDPLSGMEAARETLEHRRRLAGPGPSPAPTTASIAYEAMSTVPENWIPFIPVHIPGDNREIQLQRGAMPRVLNGGGPVTPPAKVRPRTTLLREGMDNGPLQPYYVHEEEVPRVGTRLTLAFNRTRSHDGRPVVWLGVKRSTGRGEASSGLAWDHLKDRPPPT